MNRRKFLYSAGGLSFGTIIGSNLISRSALSASIDINNTESIPENWESPSININFSKFKVKTRNIDIDNKLIIKIKSGMNGNLELIEDNQFEIDLDTGNGVNEISEIESVDITNSSEVNISDLENKDYIDIDVQIELECDGIYTETDISTITFDVIDPKYNEKEGSISRWTFDDYNTSNNILEDVWGDNDGTIVGDVQTGLSGPSGEAYYFDGNSGNYISVPSINPRDEITVSAWIKSGVSGEYNHHWSIVSNYKAWILGPRNEHDDKMAFIVHTENEGWNYDSVKSIDNPEEWHHFVGTYDFTIEETKLYHNGELVSTGTDPDGRITGDFSSFEIGRREGRSGQTFNGFVDDVRIYDIAFSASEVSNLYKLYQ